eukprot:766480-Hanusia_phi.AAC.21
MRPTAQTASNYLCSSSKGRKSSLVVSYSVPSAFLTLILPLVLIETICPFTFSELRASKQKSVRPDASEQ